MDRAIDGMDATTNFWHNPHEYRANPNLISWYQVELDRSYFIPKVILEDRNDGCCPTRLENTEVRIGFDDYSQSVMNLNPLCFEQDFEPPSITSVYVCESGPMEGRFVLARKIGPTTNEATPHSIYAMTIRELRIWVVE